MNKRLFSRACLFKTFADETEQRDGSEQRGTRRNDEQLFTEDVGGYDNDDDDDHTDNVDVDVDNDSRVNGDAICARGIRSIDIVQRDRPTAAMSLAMATGPTAPFGDLPDHGHVVLHIFVGFVVHGGHQAVNERSLFLARVSKEISPWIVQQDAYYIEISNERWVSLTIMERS